MIRLSEKCFTQAKNLVKKGEGEPWLHSYMLGKTSERLQKSPDVYLNFFRLVSAFFTNLCVLLVALT